MEIAYFLTEAFGYTYHEIQLEPWIYLYFLLTLHNKKGEKDKYLGHLEQSLTKALIRVRV